MAKLTINVDEVLPSLAQVAGVVNAKSPLPILSNVVFVTRMGASVEERAFSLTASDSETWVTMAVPSVAFDEEMRFCVNAADIVKVLSNLKGRQVEMVLDHESHTIKCSYGKGRFVLPFESTDDFPLPSMDMDGAYERYMNPANLQRALEKTSFAIANEKLRPIMNGVHFDLFNYGMVAVATDGQKLAKYTDKTVRLDVPDDSECGFTLPKKPVGLLLGLLNGCDTEVKLTFNEKCVSVSNGDFKLLTRLLEGNYPKYDRVIPQDNNVETIVPKAEMIEALKRVLPMGNASSELVKLSFTMGTVTISAEDFNFSKSADENIDCDFASQELAIGFNGGYLLEVLQNIDGDDVKVCLKEPSRAGLFKPTDDDDTEEYISLLMPIFV
jgi:DNA polymerase-3 subunit beta